MSEDKYPKIKGEMKIKITEDVLSGKYANQIVILHSPEEFILDFVAAFPPEGAVVSRIILSPGHYKRILSAMHENLLKYEEQYGEIKAAGIPEPSETKTSIH
jgi:hypothetical protein